MKRNYPRIDKREFANVVIGYSRGEVTDKEFVNWLYRLANTVFNTRGYTSSERDDIIQEAVLKIFKYRTWERIDPHRPDSVFSYFWGRMQWTIQTELHNYIKRKQAQVSIDQTMLSRYLSQLERSSGPLKLSDIEVEQADDELDDIAEEQRLERIKRKQHAKLSEEAAKHWRSLFDYIAARGRVPIDEALNILPSEFRSKYKNIKRSAYHALARAARRNNARFSTENGFYVIELLGGASRDATKDEFVEHAKEAAKRWSDLFDYLQQNGSASEQELLRMLPDAFKSSYKDVRKSMRVALKRAAERAGCRLSFKHGTYFLYS